MLVTLDSVVVNFICPSGDHELEQLSQDKEMAAATLFLDKQAV